MRMNMPRGTIFIVAAVAAGLVATFAINRYVTMKTRVPMVATRSVIIASGDISPGISISPSMVKTANWPMKVIPPKAAATLGDVTGRVAKVPIPQGNPVLFSMLAPEGTAAGLSGILPDGKRALTVKVDEVAGVAGFLHPGDHVDVLVDLPMADKEHFSKTILSDILVMTTGQIWQQKGDSKPVVVNTVTLELTPEESEVLNLASNRGKIRLALRNRNNRDVTQTAGVTTANLLTGISRNVEAKAAAPATTTAKTERRVEVIKGLDRTDAKL